MSAKTSIAVLDNSTTPEAPGTPAAATRTFIPGEVENGNVHTFYETTTGTTARSRSKLTVSLTPKQSAVVFQLRLSTPKATVVDDILVVQHVTRSFVEFELPNDGSRDDRLDNKSLTANILNDATIHNMIKDLENLY